MKAEIQKEDLKFRLDVQDTNFFSCKIDGIGGDLKKFFLLEKANISVSMVDSSTSQILHIDTNDRPIALNISTRVCSSSHDSSF